ncbi:MAG: hypothetical protein A2600_09970 [Candidatus Lambdaproteobacteria bacterium RIFOXYD1_FULL_56_27]|uniref:Uncharacterized protein n=1 Tax=Candidatus Lambdaproteobacteria bacterium RIFOXYD2_FULL_56_26 TaxID=1817773 RepID=A0A1F6GU39_9PROT|nr:MAG: hypothetical protein A2557_11720 [Candidatus Lambdaproteobacteria bacterium RIFOXYD2_FULL_56_26]OGH07406.1 MAG: hypothetical protein A2600_09970 [Candidatus Lambdaproteobacteria bacterium RIFOXYD1_FULL_56_27]
MDDLFKVGLVAGAAYAVSKPTQENALLMLGFGVFCGFLAVKIAESEKASFQLDFNGHVRHVSNQMPTSQNANPGLVWEGKRVSGF